MIDKKILSLLKGSKKFVIYNVFFQWLAMFCNIYIVLNIVNIFGNLVEGTFIRENLTRTLVFIAISIIIRALCIYIANNMAYRTTKGLKSDLRHKIYSKLLGMGSDYREDFATSELVQLSIEGVEQLEVYFSKYLPQFIYSLLVPLSLFIILSRYSLKVSLILLLGVPLIPISIALVAKFAKKTLDKYWSIYTDLGDSFLENLQGLTTLKIYQADDYRNELMNEEAEKFRLITMKVLSMQLNSITIMDLVAFGGAALGMIITIVEFQRGNLNLAQSLGIIILSSEFFIPMRLLGSFFHISMNGVSAADKIFKILDLDEDRGKEISLGQNKDIEIKNLNFAYEEDRTILKDINIDIKEKQFISIVGESGSGKSTLAKLLMGYKNNYQGSILLGDRELRDISTESLMDNITYIGHREYIYKGRVGDYLDIPKKDINDKDKIEALKKVNLMDFLEEQGGLNMLIEEGGSNLSGGQRQRLALAKGLLKDSPIYIFDEATSNIDSVSEDSIMKTLYKLKSEKTIILISHRLYNVVDSDLIYVLDKGSLVEKARHRELIGRRGHYYKMYERQAYLEEYALDKKKGGLDYA